jgi:hypothetical protein
VKLPVKRIGAYVQFVQCNKLPSKILYSIGREEQRRRLKR